MSLKVSFWNKQFWADAGERALKTAAQVAALVILGTAATVGDGIGFDFRSVAWDDVGAYALGGAILSVLFSFGSRFRGDPDTATLTTGTFSPVPHGQGDVKQEINVPITTEAVDAPKE